MTLSIQSYKASWKYITVAVLVAIFVLINLFQIGGSTFIFNLNNFIVPPLAIGVTILAIMLWRPLGAEGENRLLWSGLTVGWGLWTTAELWWAVAGWIGQEVPYPSWADVFWLAGYMPMYIALWARIRSLPKIVDPLQRIGIIAVSLFSLGFTILFIFIPIVQSSDPTAILESTLNILYPLADLILLILVLRIFFIYQHGMYGQAWRWLALGFIFFAFGDLTFAYANTADLYYPGQQLNLLSTFGVDVPYDLSYLLFLIGLFLLQTMHSTHGNIAEAATDLVLVPNTHLLVFTKADDTVMDVSKNYASIFPRSKGKGNTLSESLGISLQDAEVLLQDIKINEVLRERPLTVTTFRGQEDILISGIAVFLSAGVYSGAILLLRYFAEDCSLDEMLSDYQKEMVRSLQIKTGTAQQEEAEIKKLLEGYYQEFFKAFYNRAVIEGGIILADAFITELQAVVRQQEWQISMQPVTLLDVSHASLAEIKEALPILFEAAKRFTVKITDETRVNRIVEQIQSKLGEATLKNISYFEKTKDRFA